MKSNEYLRDFIFSQFRSVRQFTKHLGLHDQVVGDYLHLRIKNHSPYKKSPATGADRFTKTALLISAFAEIDPSILFPAELYGVAPVLDQLPMNSYYSTAASLYQWQVDPTRQVLDDEVRKFVIDMLKVLKPTERFVLCRRYVSEITLEECGDLLGVSRQYIQQIEEKAMRTLRKPAILKVAEDLI